MRDEGGFFASLPATAKEKQFSRSAQMGERWKDGRKENREAKI